MGILCGYYFAIDDLSTAFGVIGIYFIFMSFFSKKIRVLKSKNNENQK